MKLIFGPDSYEVTEIIPKMVFNKNVIALDDLIQEYKKILKTDKKLRLSFIKKNEKDWILILRVLELEPCTYATVYLEKTKEFAIS